MKKAKDSSCNQKECKSSKTQQILKWNLVGAFLLSMAGLGGYFYSEVGEKLKGDVVIPEPPAETEFCETFDGFASGDGSEKNPWKIANLDDLQGIDCATQNYNYDYEVDDDQHFELINDIDASATSQWNPNYEYNEQTEQYEVEYYQGFEPIGNNESFSGRFHGNGHKITNLYINRPNDENVGLFGYVSDGVLESIALENPEVTGGANVGALVGYFYEYDYSNSGEGGKLQNVYATGVDVDGGTNIGGLIGYAENSYDTILNTYVTGTVSCDQFYGDQTVLNTNFLFVNTAHAQVSEGPKAGGLLGINYYSSLVNSFADVIMNCRAQSHSYHAPSFISTVHAFDPQVNTIGGLIGQSNGGNVTNSYFTDSNKNNGIGTLESGGASAFMVSTHAIYGTVDVNNPWDFEAVWNTLDGTALPTLRHRTPTSPPMEVWVDDDYTDAGYECDRQYDSCNDSCNEDYDTCIAEAPVICEDNCNSNYGPDCLANCAGDNNCEESCQINHNECTEDCDNPENDDHQECEYERDNCQNDCQNDQEECQNDCQNNCEFECEGENGNYDSCYDECVETQCGGESYGFHFNLFSKTYAVPAPPIGKTCEDDGHTANVDCFYDIQAAVNAVAAGGIVHVADGSYKQFEINKNNITVKADGSAATINKKDPNRDSRAINIYGGKAIIDGLVIAGDYEVGIYLEAEGNSNAGTEIKNNTIDLRAVSNPGKYEELRGIRIYASTESTSDEPVSITNNTILYALKDTSSWQRIYGMYLSTYDEGRYIVSGNTLTDMTESGNYCDEEDNEGEDCERSVRAIRAQGSSGPSVISSNAITSLNGPNFRTYGIRVRSGKSGGNLTIEKNNISKMGYGIHADYYDEVDVTVQKNNIIDGTYGVYMEESVSGFHVNQNNIYGNTEYGAYNDEQSDDLDAARNWWGDASGPTHEENEEGEGDEISDYVDYEDWATSKINLGDNVVFTSDNSGYADVPTGENELRLGKDKKLDLSKNVKRRNGKKFVFGKDDDEDEDDDIDDAEDYSNKFLKNVDLTKKHGVGDVEVEVDLVVKLNSTDEGEDIIIENEDLEGVSVAIPDQTTVMASETCDFLIQAPTQTSTEGGKAPSGFSFGDFSFEVGSSECVILFDQPLKIEVDGVYTNIAYRPSGSENWITIPTCGGPYEEPENPEFPGDCSLTNGSTKTKVLTYHLTNFSSVTPKPVVGGGAPTHKQNTLSNAYYLSERGSDDRVETVEAVSTQKTQGKVTQPVVLKNIYTKETLELRKDTTITDHAGNVFVDMILPPKRTENVAVAPKGMQILTAVIVNSSTNAGLQFSKSFTLTIPANVLKKDAENIKVFMYNEDKKSYELVRDGGSANAEKDVVTIKARTTGVFVVIDTKGKALPVVQEILKPSAPKIAGQTASVPAKIELPVPPFADVQGHWAAGYINDLRTRGVVVGRTSKNYEPNALLTYAEFSSILQKAFGVGISTKVYQTLLDGYKGGVNPFVSRGEVIKIILDISGVELSTPVKQTSFRDVEIGSPLAKYVGFADGNNLLDGFSDNTFRTDEAITRSGVARVVSNTWKLMGKRPVFRSSAPKMPSFSTDQKRTIPEKLIQPVPAFVDMKNHWAATHVDTLRLRGVITGKTMNDFVPNATVSYAELADIASRAFGINLPSGVYEDIFASNNSPISRGQALKTILDASGLDIRTTESANYLDVPAGSYYEKYINFARKNNLLDGFRGGTFQPGKSITRSEVARVVAEIWELMK